VGCGRRVPLYPLAWPWRIQGSMGLELGLGWDSDGDYVATGVLLLQRWHVTPDPAPPRVLLIFASSGMRLWRILRHKPHHLEPTSCAQCHASPTAHHGRHAPPLTTLWQLGAPVFGRGFRLGFCCRMGFCAAEGTSTLTRLPNPDHNILSRCDEGPAPDLGIQILYAQIIQNRARVRSRQTERNCVTGL
jgi:hypothetical protein